MLLVLVIDDDPMQLEMLTLMIKRLGMDVLSADGPENAKPLFSEEVNLVLTDCEMPGGGGPEVLRAFREMGFEQPVILMSGNHELAKECEGFSGFLPKPFFHGDLVSLIHKVLS